MSWLPWLAVSNALLVTACLIVISLTGFRVVLTPFLIYWCGRTRVVVDSAGLPLISSRTVFIAVLVGFARMTKGLCYVFERHEGDGHSVERRSLPRSSSVGSVHRFAMRCRTYARNSASREISRAVQ
eukprot:IDg17247t1